MEGIIASCEIEKQSSDMFCEMNTNKIVLDFLRFLKRYEKSMKDITDLKNDRYKVDKLATNLFGNKNKAREVNGDHGRRIRHGLHKTAILNRDENINDHSSLREIQQK